MKVLYVGDGRCRLNWGARATSTALHDLLQQSNVISGFIESSAKDASFVRIVSVPFLSNAVSKRIDVKQPKAINFLTRVAKKAKLKAGIVDYISDNIDESIENFLKKKSEYSELELIYKKIYECDAVALNGEGSFIFKTPARRDALFFLFILKLAIKLGKKAYYLNAIISDCPVTGRNNKVVNQMIDIFKKCDFITLRDPLSYRVLNEMSELSNTKFVPDALFSWFDDFQNRKHLPANAKGILSNANAHTTFDKPYICVSGSSLAAWNKEAAASAYKKLIVRLKNLNLQIFIVPTCTGDLFLNNIGTQTNTPVVPLDIDILKGGAILANAALFISGRYHPSILASLGGTPCIFLGSNSHKTISLQEMLEYSNIKEYNASPDESDIENILADVQHILSLGQVLRDKILNTVERLSGEAKKVKEIVK